MAVLPEQVSAMGIQRYAFPCERITIRQAYLLVKKFVQGGGRHFWKKWPETLVPSASSRFPTRGKTAEKPANFLSREAGRLRIICGSSSLRAA
jgi:hypothetical protein